jgi:hypothetical protein
MKRTAFSTPDGYSLWGYDGGPQMFVRLKAGDPKWKRSFRVLVKNVCGFPVGRFILVLRPEGKPGQKGLTFFSQTINQGLDEILTYLEQTGTITGRVGTACQERT